MPDFAKGSVVRPQVRAIFLPRFLLEQKGVKSEFVRIFEIKRRPMYAILPDGSVFPVDYQRATLQDKPHLPSWHGGKPTRQKVVGKKRRQLLLVY